MCERPWRYLQTIARKDDLISMYRGALVRGNVKISVYFLNKRIIFKPLDKFFRKFKNLEINRPFI